MGTTRTLITSSSLPETVCDTTSIRYFTICDRFDLLVELFGGKVLVPRQVFDPTEDAGGILSLKSEVVRAEAYYSQHLTSPENVTYWSRFRALHSRLDIHVLDMTQEEMALYSHLTSDSLRHQHNLVQKLGPGESAVMAIAETRDWNAAIDDGAARAVLAARAPALTVYSTGNLLRACVSRGLTSTDEAIDVYLNMKALNYRGPDSLY